MMHYIWKLERKVTKEEFVQLERIAHRIDPQLFICGKTYLKSDVKITNFALRNKNLSMTWIRPFSPGVIYEEKILIFLMAMEKLYPSALTVGTFGIDTGLVEAVVDNLLPDRTKTNAFSMLRFS